MRELIIHDADASRTQDLSSALAARAAGRASVGAPDPTGCDMVRNATSAGLKDGDELPIAAHLLGPSMFVGDVIAGHGMTPLLQAAGAAGRRTAGSDPMVEAVQDMMLDFMWGNRAGRGQPGPGMGRRGSTRAGGQWLNRPQSR